MRVRAETMLIAVMALFAFTGWFALRVLDQDARPSVATVAPAQVDPVPSGVPDADPVTGAGWFREVRPPDLAQLHYHSSRGRDWS